MREVDAPAGDWLMRYEFMKVWTPDAEPDLCPQTGKVRYRRKRDAVASVHARSRCRWKPGRNLRVYECPICGDWHMTHKTKGDR